MKLGTENRKEIIAAIALAVVLIIVVFDRVIPTFSTNASTNTAVNTPAILEPSAKPLRGTRHNAASNPAKKARPAQDLDPTLHLQQLEASERIKYEGSGKNIFVAQADTTIPMPLGNGAAPASKQDTAIYTPPAVAAPPPIPLKFFGFASHPGEPKRIFLSKGDDVFIAGEGEVVDRRYKVLRISPNSVEIQDVVGSGAPQTIPLTQG